MRRRLLVALAVIVNLIELLCTAGLPALYTQILTMQQLPAWANYCYLALYILAYMLDDTILLVAEDRATNRVVGTASVILEIGANADLLGEFSLPNLIQLVPKGEQVFLAGGRQSF